MADLEKEPARGTRPARRPIPLPPRSLRPPPRVRPGSPAGPEGAAPSAVLSRERRRGTRRGFLIGLGVPLLGFLIVGALVLRGRPQGTDAGPDVLVRARVDRDPAETASAAGERDDLPEAETEGATVPETGAGTVPQTGAGTGTETGAGPAAPAGAHGPVSIQVASFRTTRRAQAVLAEVSLRTGLAGVVLPTTVNGVGWQRILLGAFASEAEARTAARALLEDGTIGEILIRPVPERSLPELTGGASP